MTVLNEDEESKPLKSKSSSKSYQTKESIQCDSTTSNKRTNRKMPKKEYLFSFFLLVYGTTAFVSFQSFTIVL